jgi:hypothetical protein
MEKLVAGAEVHIEVNHDPRPKPNIERPSFLRTGMTEYLDRSIEVDFCVEPYKFLTSAKPAGPSLFRLGT